MWRCWGVVGEAGIWQWELEDDIFGFKVPGKVSRRLAQYIHLLLIQWRGLIGALSRRLGNKRCLSTVRTCIRSQDVQLPSRQLS
jgi:hypothetical protein